MQGTPFHSGRASGNFTTGAHKALQRGGEAFVSNAVIGGRYVLRACVVNFHTDRMDVEAVPEIVARVGRTVDAEMRPAVSTPE